MEEQKNSRFLLGTFGALIGAIIGAIPWLLVYVYANLIVAVLSAVIAIASFYGYKITKAKIDKKVPVVVAISSILAITAATFVVAPLILMHKEGIDISIDNLQLIYEIEKFKSAVIGNYVISLIFTIVSAGGVVATISNEIKAGKDGNEISIIGRNQQITQNESQNDENKKSRKVIVIVAVLVICIIGGVIGFIAISNNEKSSSKSKDTNKSSVSRKNIEEDEKDDDEYEDEDIESEEEFIIEGTEIKFVPTDDLIMLSGENLEKYYGTEVAEVYEMIAVSEDGDKSVSCFIYGEDDMKDLSAKEFLAETLEDLDYDEIEEVTLKGTEFEFAKINFEDNGNDYIEECYVCKIDDEFLCFDYCYPEGEDSKFNKMIKKI